MELSSEVEADLAKPTKKTGKSHYANDFFPLELHLLSSTYTELIFEYLTVTQQKWSYLIPNFPPWFSRNKMPLVYPRTQQNFTSGHTKNTIPNIL